MNPEVYLVTGGTGSFGRSVVRRLLESRDNVQVRVLSRDEEKQDLMRREFRDERIRFYLGDVRSYDSVARAMKNVDRVFHAAALKQVPSCEFFPLEAVRTNVLGSDNVVRAADAAGVSSLVCLSTDKAVNPLNAMGMTKGLMEKVALSYGMNNPDAHMTVSCVRYGNVMFSRGSVLPLWVQQAQADRPLTVTDPRMTRFMMRLQDSVGLVEHALENAHQGDLFIQRARACTLQDLAAAVLRACRSSSQIEVIGTRHGEKTSEVLATGAELARAVLGERYIRVPIDGRDLNYELYSDQGNAEIAEVEPYDSHLVPRLSVEALVDLLAATPEFHAALGGTTIGRRFEGKGLV